MSFLMFTVVHTFPVDLDGSLESEWLVNVAHISQVKNNHNPKYCEIGVWPSSELVGVKGSFEEVVKRIAEVV